MWFSMDVLKQSHGELSMHVQFFCYCFHASVRKSMMASLLVSGYRSDDASLDLLDVLDVDIAPECSRNESA
jgi:hypothetical protein